MPICWLSAIARIHSERDLFTCSVLHITGNSMAFLTLQSHTEYPLMDHVEYTVLSVRRGRDDGSPTKGEPYPSLSSLLPPNLLRFLNLDSPSRRLFQFPLTAIKRWSHPRLHWTRPGLWSVFPSNHEKASAGEAGDLQGRNGRTARFVNLLRWGLRIWKDAYSKIGGTRIAWTISLEVLCVVKPMAPDGAEMFNHPKRSKLKLVT